MTESNYGGWEKVGPLGQGGQSDVFLVRSPERVSERRNCLTLMDNALMLKTERSGQRDGKLASLAEASWNYARPDMDSELGALKVFRNRQGGSKLDAAIHTQEIKRLKNEVAVLKRGLPGLPKLLARDTIDAWIVTEYFREGSLEKQLGKYRNNPLLALKAFRSLVETVKLLHDEKLVHRDIKPANVFIRKDDELVLGDFGIVFVPNAEERVTETGEKVGPWDYMAPWLDIDERVVDVTPCSDVYMLGKVLWCVVSGKLKLFREYHRQAKFDLVRMFPDSPHMERVNLILDKCLVSEPHLCLESAAELLTVVDEAIREITRGGNLILPSGNLRLGCVMCGKGIYRPVTRHQAYVKFDQYTTTGQGISNILVRVFTCDVCGHHALFTIGYPEEGATRGWKGQGSMPVPGS